MQIFRTYQVTVYVGVWMLVSSAMATELYQERPANISQYKIVNENKLESLAAYEQMKRAEDNTRRKQLGETILYPKDEDKDVNWSDFFGLKKAVVKRWMSELNNNGSLKLMPRNRSQRKWKMNKGTSVVCYFKLCSFKQPT